MTAKNKIEVIVPVVIIIALFILSAFYSQKYGEEARSFVERGGFLEWSLQKFISIHKLEKIHKHIPQERMFWSVVLLRVMIPVDLLSYALGIFGVLGWRKYTLATVVGISPFAFIFAYMGTLPVLYQLFSIPAGVLLISIVYISGGKKFYR